MAGWHISPWSPLRCWLRGRWRGGATVARGTFWGTLIGCCAAAARPTLPLLPCGASGASMSSPWQGSWEGGEGVRPVRPPCPTAGPTPTWVVGIVGVPDVVGQAWPGFISRSTNWNDKAKNLPTRRASVVGEKAGRFSPPRKILWI